MATTSSHPPTTTEAKPAGTARWLAGLAAVLGPLLLAAAFLISPYDTNADADEIARVIAAHQGVTEVSVWLWTIGTVVLAPGLIAVGLLATARSAKLGLWGSVLFGTGLLAITSTPLLDVVALGAYDKGVDVDTMAKVVKGTNDQLAVGVPILYFVAAHVIGAILLGVALLRGRTVPAWAAWVLILSMPFNVVGYAGAIEPVTVLSFVMLAVPFGYAALFFVRHGTGWVRGTS
ncbi:hypothetical protein SAMN06272735_5430 [Streptomyces sp. TLI_55]|uniref:hypothetical protein n=1 Tax=Streptomyces sp. TLI_55 TaxID=1938861 RepID=UPI000BCA1E1A|nr:hypothetical protein [Streptomyces sp. TLI_55]SNX63620.1 hypothetical protein SAMN06272735_5430 [Streptomyces sp. TLI_55]